MKRITIKLHLLPVRDLICTPFPVDYFCKIRKKVKEDVRNRLLLCMYNSLHDNIMFKLWHSMYKDHRKDLHYEKS